MASFPELLVAILANKNVRYSWKLISPMPAWDCWQDLPEKVMVAIGKWFLPMPACTGWREVMVAMGGDGFKGGAASCDGGISLRASKFPICALKFWLWLGDFGLGNFWLGDKLSEISKKLKRKFAMAASARVCSSVCDSVFENIGTTSSLVSQPVLENIFLTCRQPLH